MIDHIQQGDLVLRRAVLPSTAKPKTGRIVLAEGEVTGHAHTVDTLGVRAFTDDDGRMFIEVPEGGAVVKHQEHGPIPIPPGVWERGIVREYDAFAEEARRVVD